MPAIPLLVLSLLAPPPTPSVVESEGFDQATFRERLVTAEWLADYDRVAWEASDLTTEASPEQRSRLSPVWFCYQEGEVWHATFGRLDDKQRYESVLHYVESSDGMAPADRPARGKRVQRLARAAATAVAKLEPLVGGSGLRFNTYVRELEDRRIEARWIPAIQGDWLFYWGIDFRLVISKDGRTIESFEPHGERAHGMRMGGDEVPILDNTENAVPTVAQLLHALITHRFDQLVLIRSQDHASSLVTSDDGVDFWFHGAPPP